MLKVEHAKWSEALQLVYMLLLSILPGEVICIAGPSRAGKTRLIHEIIKLLIGEKDYLASGELPVVSVKASNNSRHGTFSTKSFTKSLLNAVDHPFYGGEDLDSIQKQDRISEDVYWQALIKALRARKVRYLFIDEAQHARYVSKDAKGAYAVMDSWKCLAEEAGIILIIVGAYPIIDIVRKSPHMIGRKHQVNLGRYRVEEADLMEFKGILEAYGEVLNCTSLLIKNMQLFYRGSLGCIGLVRHWLMRAVALAITRETALSEEILQETIPSDDDISSLLEEINHGEMLLDRMTSESDVPETKKIKKGKTKPFQRKAERIKSNKRMAVSDE
ncbi:TniB family NTP-binding protein [Bermanella sp. R86510]|uniref:TniB family NTP-binding protein n=1 Tax=unclassified Bermanella TaxID=2627862 RepID=UPI0037CA30F1